MYYVFLDTNIFVSNFQFDSKFNKKLLKYAERQEIVLCLTKVNYKEILKKYKDKISPIVNIVKKQNSEYLKYSGKLLHDDLQRVKYHVDNYQKYLDSLILKNNIQIVEHSSDFTNTLIDKYFSNEKPFDNNKLSFVDAIIWESIKDFYENEFDCYDDQIFFITNNIKDFAQLSKSEGTPYKLYPNLKKDAPDLAIYDGVEQFFEYEEESLHDYLIDIFYLEEGNTQSIIIDYLENIEPLKVHLAIDHFLANRNFEGDHYSGWGELNHEEFSTLEILEASKDIESGEIEIILNIYYDIIYDVVTKNPIFETDDEVDSEYLSETAEKETVTINAIIYINDSTVTNFKVEDIFF